MKRKLFTCLAIALPVLIFSCKKDNGEDGNNNPTPGPLFTSVRTIVQTNCAISGCHTGSNAQNGINFSADNTIVAQKDRIKLRAVDQAGTPAQMPPSGPPLPVADRQKITDWVNAGGKLTD